MDQRVKVLCVDDEPQILSALTRALFDEEYELLTAESGKKGLEILAAEPSIQVVVSDFRMPAMNGVDFLKQVCERWPETVRIVLSGYADTAAVVAAINEGEIYRFIPKPWHDEELKITIAKAIDLYALQAKNRALAWQLDQVGAVSRRARGILDVLPVGVLVVDEHGLIVDHNRPIAAFLGQAETPLAGKRLADCLPADLLALATRVQAGETDGLTLGSTTVTGLALPDPGPTPEWLLLLQWAR